MNAEIFQAGSTYLITTEKVIVIEGDAPWRELMKRSTYAVNTLAERPSQVPSWMSLSGLPHIGIHARKGSRYLLCTLASEAGIRGSSEFINMQTGDIYAKKEVAQYLSHETYDSEFLSIGIDSIKEATPLSPVRTDPRVNRDEAESLYAGLDDTCRELILDGKTNREREQAIIELTGCDFLVATDVMHKHFHIDNGQPF